MNVQTIFYTLGSVFLVLCIAILLGVGYILFQIKKIVKEVSLTATTVRNRIENVRSISSFGRVLGWGFSKILNKVRNKK